MIPFVDQDGDPIVAGDTVRYAGKPALVEALFDLEDEGEVFISYDEDYETLPATLVQRAGVHACYDVKKISPLALTS